MFDYSKVLGKIREKHLTQRELAEKIGITEQTLISKLNGKSYFRADEVIAICEALEIHAYQIPEYFFTKKVQKTEQEAEK